MDEAEEFCRKLIGKPVGDFSLDDRHRVAFALGYFPADLSAYLWDTYGLPIVDQYIRCRERGLRIDWLGFQYEMAKRGADVSGQVSEGKRLQELIEKK